MAYASYNFNGSDENLLISSFSSSTPNQRTFTISAWVKVNNLTATQALIDFRETLSSPQDEVLVQLQASGTDFFFFAVNNAATVSNENKVTFLNSTGVWYHIVVAVDTTNATANDRIRVYIDNVEQTLVQTTVITQNATLEALFVNGGRVALGSTTTSPATGLLNGKLAFIDVVEGLQLTPSSFALTNGSTWTRRAYTGSFGTHGWSLDGSNTFNDVSGNGKNFTGVNMDSSNLVDTDLPPHLSEAAGDVDGVSSPIAAAQALFDAAGSSAGVSTAIMASPDFVDAAASSTGSATAIMDAQAITEAALSAAGVSLATMASVDVVEPDVGTITGGAAGGGMGMPPAHLLKDELRRMERRQKRIPKTHLIKIGEWPEEVGYVETDPLDLNEILRAQPRDKQPSHDDGDDMDAMMEILALAA